MNDLILVNPFGMIRQLSLDELRIANLRPRSFECQSDRQLSNKLGLDDLQHISRQPLQAKRRLVFKLTPVRFTGQSTSSLTIKNGSLRHDEFLHTEGKGSNVNRSDVRCEM